MKMIKYYVFKPKAGLYRLELADSGIISFAYLIVYYEKVGRNKNENKKR